MNSRFKLTCTDDRLVANSCFSNGSGDVRNAWDDMQSNQPIAADNWCKPQTHSKFFELKAYVAIFIDFLVRVFPTGQETGLLTTLGNQTRFSKDS